MVISDESLRSTMITNGAHHYIQPAPFSPTEAEMDVKSSPLAMLQKTCSSIGVDSTPVKSVQSDNKKNREDASKDSMQEAKKTPTCFRPYDLDRKSEAKRDSGDESASENSAVRNAKSPGEKSTESRKTPKSETSSSASTSGAGTSPITRPGSEVLAGVHAKELHSLAAHKPGGSLPLQLPPYLSPELMSTALRPTLPSLPGLYSHSGLPPTSYLGLHPHHRLGERCSLPYCPCAFAVPPAMPSQHGIGSPACPSGCRDCEHAKVVKSLSTPMPSIPAYATLGASPLLPGGPPSALGNSPLLAGTSPLHVPPTSLGLGIPGAAGATVGGQIVCSWMAEGRYCGKRFATTEELMQHLRSHTSLAGEPPLSSASLLAIHPAYHCSILAGHKNPLIPPALPPLSAARYHPYAKPPSHPAGGLGGNVGAHHSGTLPVGYYSPYASLYARPPLLP